MASKTTKEQVTNPAKKISESIKTPENKKEKKKMQKSFIETFKTIVITILVTAIVAFVLGIQYEKGQNDTIKAEAASIVKNVKVSVQPAPSK